MIQADRKTISSWTKDAFKQIKGRFQADQRTIFKQIKGRFQADQRRLQADKKDYLQADGKAVESRNGSDM